MGDIGRRHHTDVTDVVCVLSTPQLPIAGYTRQPACAHAGSDREPEREGGGEPIAGCGRTPPWSRETLPFQN